MLKVNGKDIEWKEGITFSEIYRLIGYSISNPRVIIRVNGETVPKSARKTFLIPDASEIEIVNTLCGG